MAACVNCDRTLQPAWKYCVFCGTRTAVAATAPRSRPLPGPASGTGGPRRATAPARTPVPAFTLASTGQIPVAPVGGPTGNAPTPARVTATPAASAWPRTMGDRPSLRSALASTASRAPEVVPVRVNTLAIVALLLGVLASPLAALFGHIALGQLRASGERGVVPAWIATVLGYVWLGFFLVLGIMYLATDG